MAGNSGKAKIHWHTIRQISQWIFLTAFLILFIITASRAVSEDLLKLPARLSPLLMIAQSIASRVVLAGSSIGLITILLTIVFGRAWCGWICPVGTVLDIFPFHKKTQLKSKPIPESWRSIKYVLLAVIFFAAVVGNLTLLLDPLTLWVRTLTGSVWPALNAGFTAVEYAAAQIPGATDVVVWFDQLVRPAVFPDSALGTRLTWLPLLLFAAIILLNILAERFWCRYLCPLGGLLGLISRLAIFKREVSDGCKNCAVCSRDCPTGTIDPARGFRSDPAECTLCMDCLESCPGQDIHFRFSKPLFTSFPYDPSRRAILASAAIGLGGTAVFQAEKLGGSVSPFLIRPPGVVEDDFLSKCLRCGICVRACPTGVLQPAVTESGLTGLFTPVLVTELGYCQFSCNECGQVCPVEAIPPLTLPEKQQSVIGRAYINRNRCIPWSENGDCIVCEEMCPLPEKAIILDEKEMVNLDGESVLLKLPVVIPERCIGCGICEYKCPQVGEAAIRVYKSYVTL